MQNTDKWSKHWKSSNDPSKQRKYRRNAPQHVKENFISSNVSQDLRDRLGTRRIKLRTGDQIKVMRGDKSGETGIVNEIDFDNEVVYADGITTERNDGTEVQIALRPSNVQVVAMNVDDQRRMEKYEVDDLASIEVDEEEMEEALEEDEEGEMMKQMQTGESSMDPSADEEDETEDADENTEEEKVEEDENEEESEDELEESSADYSDLVSGTIGDAKDQIQEMEDPDYESILQAEKDKKNRTTFVDWLESKVE